MHIRMTLAAVAAIGAAAITGCGDDDSGSSTAGNGTDRAFVAEMVPHHESAIAMAEIAKERGDSAFVKELADDILTTQNQEIATMRREDEGLDTAGVTAGSLGVPDHAMGMNDDPASLRDAEPFDEAFLKMMISHHEGAITMARAELAKGADPELKALAQDIIDAQQREIDEMRRSLGDDDGTSGEEMHESDSEHGG